MAATSLWSPNHPPPNERYRVDYSDLLPPVWSSFTNIITSSNGLLNFTDHGLGSGELGGNRFYRVRTSP